jgi:outer membrane protein
MSLKSGIISGVLVAMFGSGCSHFQGPKYASRSGEYWTAEKEIANSSEIMRRVETHRATVTVAPGEKLDLARCVDIALNNNPGTRQAWQAAKAAAAQKQVTDSIFYPSVTAGVNATRNSTGDFNGAGQTITDQYQPNLQISYLLFNFGGNYASSRAARDAMYSANYNYNRALQNVTLAVEENFYNFRAAEASIDAARFNVEDARHVYEASRVRLDAGLGTRQDLLRAEANLRQAEFQIQSQLSQAETVRAALAQVLGMAVSSDFRTAEMVVPENLEGVHKDVTALTAEALNARPDLMSAYATAQSKEGSVKATRSSLWPQLIFQVTSAGLTTVRNRPENPTEDWTAVIALSWNIFNGFGDLGRIKLAEADLASAKESLRNSYYQVVADVWSAYYALDAAREQAKAGRAQLAAATAALELTQAGYQNGLNTLLELVASQNDLANARLIKIQGENNFFLALARLANAVGRVSERPRK